MRSVEVALEIELSETCSVLKVNNDSSGYFKLLISTLRQHLELQHFNTTHSSKHPPD